MLAKIMSWALLRLLLLMTLSCRSCADREDVPFSCLDHQKAFGNSCFELVALRRSFFGAQAWCERSGGHLAFIADEDTQEFLQRHLDPETDVWFGVASSPTDEGLPAWLDGSPVSYSKWVSSPPLGSSCGHILPNAGFQWEATRNCAKNLHFICQFESGRSIVCADYKPTLRCGTGQVVMIDRSFYGRGNPHYCRATFSPATSTRRECGWMDVLESVAAHCDGRRLCQAAELMSSFGEQCAGASNYLSVDFHCEDGLTLSVDPVAAVFDPVPIRVKLLRRPAEGSFSCELDTGDGHVVYLDSLRGTERSMLHIYSLASTFIVVVECISGDVHSTDQKMITVHEPVTKIGVIRCFAGNASFSESNCKALHGAPLQIQAQVKAGTNVTYRIQRGEQLLSGVSVLRGNLPQNITVSPDVVEHLGPGCHRLKLHASNVVTVPEVSTGLQVCVMEKIAGLHASVLPDCSVPQVIPVGVSLGRGAPVQLRFSLVGDNSSFAETKKMATSKEIFNIRHPIQGAVQVRVRAWNDFSSLDEDVDVSGSCGKTSLLQVKSPDRDFLGFHNKTAAQRIRVARSLTKIIAEQSWIANTGRIITLSLSNPSEYENPEENYAWVCDECKCKEKSHGLKRIVTTNCLPEPFQFFRYHFQEEKNGQNNKHVASICIFLTPTYVDDLGRLNCFVGCNPIQDGTDAKIKMVCSQCPTNVVWGIEDPNDESEWKTEAKSCYTASNKRPIAEKQDGGNEYTVKHSSLATAKSKGQNITVVIFKKSNMRFTTFTIVTSSSGSTPDSAETTTSANEVTPVMTKTTPAAPFATSKSTAATQGITTTTTTTPEAPTTPAATKATTASKKTTLSTTEATAATTKATLTPTRLTEAPATKTSLSTPNSKTTGASTKTGVASTEGTTSAVEGTTAASKGTAAATNRASSATRTTFPGSTHVRTAATTPLDICNVGSFTCSFSPSSGTVIIDFTMTCTTTLPCINCQYCFSTYGLQQRCSAVNPMEYIFFPLGGVGGDLIVTATAKNSSCEISTDILIQVSDDISGNTAVQNLQLIVDNAVSGLDSQQQLSGQSVAQLFYTTANKINYPYNAAVEVAERTQLREGMLFTLIDVIGKVPITTPHEVYVVAQALGPIVFRDVELGWPAQLGAATLLFNLSVTLLVVDLPETVNNDLYLYAAADYATLALSYMYAYSFDQIITDLILATLYNLLSALLRCALVNDPPIVIHQDGISLYARRVSIDVLISEPIIIPNCICASFSLTSQPASVFPVVESVNERAMSLVMNPHPYHHDADITSVFGGLSLTERDQTEITLSNLKNDIEIFLPRPEGEQTAQNSSALYLGQFSTAVINVTSENDTLVLKMLPSTQPLRFIVYLGYQQYPNKSYHIARTTMPLQGITLEEQYTWLIDPEVLNGNTGLHYVTVMPIVGPNVQSVDATLTISTLTASCKFWNETRLNWTMEGCRVGPKSIPSVTHCLCNHLTFFGSSFFVAPNLVDPSRTIELFRTVAENFVVVCFVGTLFGTYFVVVIWARWKDIRDVAKVKVTVLDDNDPMDQYRYLLIISTGYRIGASTSSQVTATLLGADGNSEPHHLTDPKKAVFERGAVDWFLLCTPFSLGDLEGIRLWHSNSGGHPAWYVGTVTVQDLQTRQKWHFLCNSWLSVDMDDCTLDKVFPTAAEGDLKRFSNLFFMRTSRDFNDGHLWFSVVNRPASSTFTCVQRVSCCFSLLLCTMLTSIMFYGIPTDPAEETLDLGHFEFTWQQLMVGVQSSLIMFPVNILIVSVFRNARPRQMSCCQRKNGKNIREKDDNSQSASTNITLDDIIKEITRLAQSLSKSVKSNVPSAESEFGPGQQNDINAVLSVLEDFIKQNSRAADSAQSKTQPPQPESSAGATAATTSEVIDKKSNKTWYLYKQLCHIEKELGLLGPSAFPTAQSHGQALQQVQRMKGFLEEQLFKSDGINVEENSPRKFDQADSSDDEESTETGKKKKKKKKKKTCCHGGLPWWCVFIGWLLVLASSVVSGYFTMLYGLQFGKQKSLSWLMSMSISFFQSLLLIQPIKVLCFALFFALIVKKVDEEDFQNVPKFDSKRVNPGDGKDLQALRRDNSIYTPPLAADIEKLRRNKLLEKKAFALLREILTYLGFMWMLLLVAYGQRDPNAFLLNKHIRKSFTRNVSNSMSLGDVFTWANTSLLSNLFGVYPGFITDGNSKLVGNARLRQLRVKRSPCGPSGFTHELVQNYHAPYSWDSEDTSSYDAGWNRTVSHNCSTAADPWTYQTQTGLRSYPTWGNLVLYRGGGFVAELGPDLKNARSTLEYLLRNKWLDAYTRAIFVEFTVYNANVNLFCIVTLLLETAAIGAFQLHAELQSIRLYQSTGGLHIFVLAAEIIYLLFILYYMVLQGKLMKQQRCAYFKSKWNLVDLTIILLSCSAVAVFTARTLLGARDITYYQSHKDQFASFYETASADASLQYLIAFVVLLATVKLWHLLRLHPKMNMISSTLQRAWSDISGFLLVIVIMLMAYSITTNVIYGWRLSSYRTLADAILTIISLQMGMFNYEEVLGNSSLLGAFLIGSCIIFMTFVVVNLLISVILVAFTEEQKHHKPSEEEEVVDMMLTKICSLFGISFKRANNNPEPDVNSRNTLNASPNDVNMLHPTP